VGTPHNRQMRNLIPLMEKWEWQHRAACRGEESSVFFYAEDEREPAKSTRTKAALKICAVCPVKQQCLEHALSVPEVYGTWGGKSQEEIRALVKVNPEALAV